MKFTEHRDSNVFAVKQYRPGLVKINDRTLLKSCFLTQHQLIEDWPCANLDSLTEDKLMEIIHLKPEVILLGTGEQHTFPDRTLFALCARHGIGLETMSNIAACRTFNVLSTEDRDVVLALIIDASPVPT
ncbi:MAG: hypothetical protein CO158_05570 [Piscirickettsiaceae bacterium CG_4_9_14_3_um_filter_43_564]|nr:Xcc1710-like domain-containing protein [Thiomicrospira sp.]OIP94237.1 MAG: hypothetical protein AUK56_09365 [Thiomicrospira sp. CG2_30_44_34]PIQ02750.1 MAG: hypothetical protein COW74_09690 [Piscirickettsiaceae bacterium CG18_big_fil_WC_8_21_14_2_50_44_103]PIU38564.1 MAG: hypothetical protein COT01_05695 [Piscirickettsiaceae bacterium CG07_land_8_20_14_0_80_44_28]PIW58422.1 MAG: hypothetical protein COW14_01065 [Piscirickettsiaceae bacterium CG12_big_fil_rev_8_21_14_0_65_44_934]PIW78710.1 M